MKSLILAALAALAFVTAASAQSLSQPGANGNGNTVSCTTFSSLLPADGVSGHAALGVSSNCRNVPDASAAALLAYVIRHCPPVDTNTKDSAGSEVFRACLPNEALSWYGDNLATSIFASVLSEQATINAQAAAAATALPPLTPAN